MASYYFAIDFSTDDDREEVFIESNYEPTRSVRNIWKQSFLHDIIFPTSILVLYPLTSYYLLNNIIQQVHFIWIIFAFTRVIRVFPKSFTFAEAFTAVTLMTTYTSYGVKQLLQGFSSNYYSSAGNPGFNAIIFMPWTISGLIFGVLMVETMVIKIDMDLLVLNCVLVIGAFIFYGVDLPVLKFIQEVILDTNSIKAITYMALILVAGLFLINLEQRNYSKLDQRKMFHILAFILFAPVLYQFDQSKPV